MSATLASLRWAATNYPLAFYSPTPRQMDFHASAHPRRLLRAGNQTGKTWAGAAEAWWHALGEHPYHVVAPPPTLGLVVCADWRAYRDVVSPKLWALAPRSRLAPDTDWNRQRGWKNLLIELDNGSAIIFRSSEGRVTGAAGMTADWLWIDEPVPQHLFGEVMTRVAAKTGPAWLTFTPAPPGGRSIDVSYLRVHIEGDAARGEPPREAWEQHRIAVTPEDLPHRSPESIRAQVASYAAWEYPQRVYGDWEGPEEGRALDAFDDGAICERIPGLRWSIGLGVDHGELAGHEVALVAIYDRASNTLIVLDEYSSPTATDPDADAAGIRRMLGRHDLLAAHVDRAVGDVNAAGKLGAGARVNDLLGAVLGIRFETPDKRPGSIEFGVRLLNVGLRRGHVRIHRRCQHLIRALRHWKGKNDDLKHYIDAMRYIGVPVLTEFYGAAEIDRLRLTRA